jgi:methionine synthase I (cobalamin-dependent)
MNDENKEQIKIQARLVKNNIKVFTILAALGALMTILFGEINVTLDKLTRVYKKQARKLRSSGVGFLVVEVDGKKYKYGPVKDIDLLVADINKLKADYMNDTTSAV